MDAELHHRTRTLWLCGILHGFTHLYPVALLPLYLRIQQDLQLSGVEQATLLVTVMGLAYFLPSYPLGILADRISRKKLLAIGLAINGLGFVLLSWAPSYPLALGAVVLAGLGGSCYHPAATALISRLFSENKGRALGFLGIGASAGFFAGPAYTGWRSVIAGSWRVPVLELGVLGILTAGLFAWLATDDGEAPDTAGPPPGLETIFPTAALWAYFGALCLAFSLRDFASAGMGSLTSLFLQKAHGFDPRVTGLALSGLFVVSVVSNPLFGGLSDRNRVPWICFVLISAAMLMSLLPRVATNWAIPVLLLYGFLFVASFPMVQAALMDSVPDAARGRVFGLFITVGGLAGNLAHWAVGHWVERLGPAAERPASYYLLYGWLAGMVLLSLTGLPFLLAIRKRECAAARSVTEPARSRLEPS